MIEPRALEGGRVEVDMGAPRLEPAEVPFDTAGLVPREVNGAPLWTIAVAGRAVELAVVSMGNPHAVIDTAQFGNVAAGTDLVAELGPLIERHARFPQRVNAGFVQRLSATQIRLRVHERGAGETLACGTGACAAVVAGIRLGWFDHRVEVHARGGDLLIEWQGGDAAVFMTGPAVTVFQGEIEL